MDIKAIIFDLDFTLADSTEAVLVCAQAGFDYAGLPCPPQEEIVRTIGMSFQEFAAIHAGELAESVVHGFHEESHRLGWLESTFLLPHAQEVLTELRRRNLPLGMASQKTQPALHGMLQHLEIIDFFDVIVPGDAVPNRKPKPDALLECARRLDIAPQAAIYVGDHPYDILASRAAGMRSAAVPTGCTPSAELATHEPDWLLGSLPELLKILDSSN